MTSAQSESHILAEVRLYLGSLPASEAMFIRINTGVFKAMWSEGVVRSAPNGTPDVMGVYRGRAVAIEAKAKRGRQSTAQVNFQVAWTAAGGVYILARSLNDVRAGLGGLVGNYSAANLSVSLP